MGGLEYNEKRQLAERLSTLAAEDNKAFTRTPAEATHYEAGYKDGQDAGYEEALQIVQEMIDNATPGTSALVITGLAMARDEMARVGAIDLEDAA